MNKLTKLILEQIEKNRRITIAPSDIPGIGFVIALMTEGSEKPGVVTMVEDLDVEEFCTYNQMGDPVYKGLKKVVKVLDA